MSSPPTPTTSIKIAPLHISDRKHQRRSSFPSVAVLNPFRKKSPLKAKRSPSPVEPYEVAPGIWSTDATAKVFGYLEPAKTKGKSQSKSVRSGTQKRSHMPTRKPVAQRDSQILDKETHQNAIIDALDHHMPKTAVELPNQISEDRSNIAITKKVQAQQKDQKERTRMVSREDRLIQRGANPRTGLVSPFVVSDSSDDNLGRDYINAGDVRWGDRPIPKGRTRSGKWKQQGVGWSLVESPRLSPIAQSIHDPLNLKVSMKQLEDKLLVEMPGVDNPNSGNATDEQIKRYQESITLAYGHGGNAAMVDPGSLPSPRHSSPDGPSTPPNKLQRIRRKLVGSGPSLRDASNDTVVVGSNERAASIPSTCRGRGSDEPPRLNAMLPNRTMKGSVLESHAENKTIIEDNHFLGHRENQEIKQVKDGSHPSSLHNTSQQLAHSGTRNEPIRSTRVDVHDSVASLTLSQWLPRLNLLPPSQFADLEISSYRRPAQMLPERLRPLDQQRKTIENACTTTITSTSNRKQEKKQRPKMTRQDESTYFPTITLRPSQKFETSEENYSQAGTLRKKSSSGTKHTEDVLDSKTKRLNDMPLPGQTNLVPEMARAWHPAGRSSQYLQQNRAPVQEAEKGGRVAMIEHHRSPQSHHLQLRKNSSPKSMIGGLGLEGAKDARNTNQRDQRNGVGTTHTCDPLGEEHEGSIYRSRWQERNRDAGRDLTAKPFAATEMALDRDGSGWFAGEWADTVQNHKKVDSESSSQEEAPTLWRSLLARINEMQSCFWAIEASMQGSAKLDAMKQRLYQMVYHVIQTLHPTSPALVTLKSLNVRAQDYLKAAKEVTLAIGYLLLLVGILLALRKVLSGVASILSWFWHPVWMVITIIRWCFLV